MPRYRRYLVHYQIGSRSVTSGPYVLDSPALTTFCMEYDKITAMDAGETAHSVPFRSHAGRVYFNVECIAATVCDTHVGPIIHDCHQCGYPWLSHPMN